MKKGRYIPYLFALLSAYILGAILELVIPAMKHFPQIPVRIFAGTIVLLAVELVRIAVNAIKLGGLKLRLFNLKHKTLPIRSVIEMQNLGVRNGLDYSFVMLMDSFDDVRTGTGNRHRSRNPKKQYDIDSEEFHRMFGRNPAQAINRDWTLTAMHEAYISNGGFIRGLRYDRLASMVTPQVAEHFVLTDEEKAALNESFTQHEKKLFEYFMTQKKR